MSSQLPSIDDGSLSSTETVYAAKPSIPGYWRRRPAQANERESPGNPLQRNPNLTVSTQRSGKIGTIHARRRRHRRLGMERSTTIPAVRPRPVRDFLLFPQWGEPYGIAGKSISRFYFSDIRYGGKRHLFVAVIEVTGRAELNAFAPTATSSSLRFVYPHLPLDAVRLTSDEGVAGRSYLPSPSRCAQTLDFVAEPCQSDAAPGRLSLSTANWWIRGHGGDPNNNRVDRLARAAALSAG